MPGQMSPVHNVGAGPAFTPKATWGFLATPTVSRIQTNISALNAGTAATGPWTITFTSAVTAGDLLVLCIGHYTVATITISDTQGNTYVQNGTTLTGAGTYLHKTYSCIAKSNSAANGNVITVSFSAGVTYVTAAIGEYSGVDTYDTQAQAIGTTTGPASSGNLTTSRSNELIIGWLSNDNGFAFTTTGTGWNRQQQVTPSGAWALQDNINAAPGAYAATATWTGGSTDWLSQETAFYSAAATAVTIPGVTPSLVLTANPGSVTVSGGIVRSAGFPQYVSPANSFSVTWAAVGDLAIICGASFAASADTITAISSTKVSGWTQVVDGIDTTNNGSVNIWAGTVNATGADTVTVTWTTVPGAFEVVADEWSGPGSGWSTTAAGSLNAASSPWPYPNLTSGTLPPGEIYWGYQQGQGSPGGGAGTGFSFIVTSDGNYISNNPVLASTTAYQPTSTGFTSGVFSAAAIFTNGSTTNVTIPGVTTGITFTANPGTVSVSLPGTNASIALVANAGSIASTLPGATAALAITANAGSISSTLPGTTSTIVLTAQPGSVSFGLAGVTTGIVFGAKTGSVSVTLPGVTSNIALVANPGSIPVALQGITAGITLHANAGSVSATIPGTTSTIVLTANPGNANIGGNVNLTGVTATVVLVANAGSVNAVIPGVTSAIVLAAKVGSVSISLLGITANVTLTAFVGFVSVGLPGITAPIVFHAPAGSASIGSNIAFTGVTARLSLVANAGSIARDDVLLGATTGIVLQSNPGFVSTGIIVPVEYIVLTVQELTATIVNVQSLVAEETTVGRLNLVGAGVGEA
jgi:hypothetical protein